MVGVIGHFASKFEPGTRPEAFVKRRRDVSSENRPAAPDYRLIAPSPKISQRSSLVLAAVTGSFPTWGYSHEP